MLIDRRKFKRSNFRFSGFIKFKKPNGKKKYERQTINTSSVAKSKNGR